jgi:hypothetical protein
MAIRAVPSPNNAPQASEPIEMSRIQLYRAAANADKALKALTVELLRLFGREAGLARYQPRGSGEPNSALLELPEAKLAADHALKLS